MWIRYFQGFMHNTLTCKVVSIHLKMKYRQEMAETSKSSDQYGKRLARERKNNSRKRQKINNTERRVHSEVCHDLGKINQLCLHCDTKFWLQEKDHKSSQASLTFTIYYSNRKVRLLPLLEFLSYLLNLYTLSASDANLFRKNIRTYNNILACTSFSANIDKKFQRRDISNF